MTLTFSVRKLKFRFRSAVLLPGSTLFLLTLPIPPLAVATSTSNFINAGVWCCVACGVLKRVSSLLFRPKVRLSFRACSPKTPALAHVPSAIRQLNYDSQRCVRVAKVSKVSRISLECSELSRPLNLHRVHFGLLSPSGTAFGLRCCAQTI